MYEFEIYGGAAMSIILFTDNIDEYLKYVRNYFSEAVPIKALAVALTTSRERSSQV